MTSSTLAETAATRVLPQPDHVSAHYWEQLAKGRLVLQRCTTCGQYQFYPRALCVSCAGEPEWTEASGRGTLNTYTIIWQNRTPPFSELVPYAVAIVELEEGVRMMSNIVECDVADLRIGMDLEVLPVAVTDDVGLPFWRPASA